MTPQEQEVAFQQQSLENGQAVLKNYQDKFAAARASGASEEVLAGIQLSIDGQTRTNNYTASSLADAQSKVTQATITPNANDADVAASTTTADSPTGTQIFDDGSTLQTFEDGSTLATDTDGTITSTNALVDPAEEAQPTNPSGDVEYPNTQAFDDGSTLETFEDGSTRAVDTDGNVTSTPPTNFAPLNAEEDPTNAQPEENVDNGIDESAEFTTDSLGNTYKNGSLYRAAEVDDNAEENANTSGGRSVPVPKGATPARRPAAQAQWSEAKDLRVKLRVPNEYLTGKASGPSNILKKNGGILFPYTPQISVENSANYASQNPLHSNYPLFFYKNSSISPINVTAKFTVQNEFEGAVLLSIIHMLRSLTKMKFGNDPDAGAPPPVCRFDAYGDYMLYNVPVAIASWRHELPDGVDYISVGRKGSPDTYGHSMVPVMSTISLTLNPMYSRSEMLEYNTQDWLSGGLERRGYL